MNIQEKPVHRITDIIAGTITESHSSEIKSTGYLSWSDPILRLLWNIHVKDTDDSLLEFLLSLDIKYLLPVS